MMIGRFFEHRRLIQASGKDVCARIMVSLEGVPAMVFLRLKNGKVVEIWFWFDFEI